MLLAMIASDIVVNKSELKTLNFIAPFMQKSLGELCYIRLRVVSICRRMT